MSLGVLYNDKESTIIVTSYHPKTKFNSPVGMEDGSDSLVLWSWDIFTKLRGWVTGVDGPISGTVPCSSGVGRVVLASVAWEQVGLVWEWGCLA